MNIKKLFLLYLILNINSLLSVETDEVECKQQEYEVEYNVWVPFTNLSFYLKPDEPVSVLFELMSKELYCKVEDFDLYDDYNFISQFYKDWDNDVWHKPGLQYSQSHNIKMKDLVPLNHEENFPYFEVLIKRVAMDKRQNKIRREQPDLAALIDREAFQRQETRRAERIKKQLDRVS